MRAHWIVPVAAAAAALSCSTFTEPNPGDGADAGSDSSSSSSSSSSGGVDGGGEGGCAADLSRDSKNCGACGHDCAGGDCVGGRCKPVLLANETTLCFTSDADDVLWVRPTVPRSIVGLALDSVGPATPRTIYEATTGSIAPLATTQCLTSTAKDVFFFDQSSVARCPKSGCSAPSTLAPASQPSALTADATNVYWLLLNPQFKRQMFSCPIAGCSAVGPTLIATDDNASPSRFGVGANDLYFPALGEIHSCSISKSCGVGGSPFASSPGAPAGSAVETLVVSSGAAAWQVGAPSYDIFACTEPSCGVPLRVGAASVPTAGSLGIDGKDVYWLDTNKGQVLRCAVAGCGSSPTVIAEGQSRLLQITVSSRYVFWSTDKAIFRLAK